MTTKCQGSWKSSKGCTVGNKNPNLQLMGLEVCWKGKPDQVERLCHMFNFGNIIVLTTKVDLIDYHVSYFFYFFLIDPPLFDESNGVSSKPWNNIHLLRCSKSCTFYFSPSIEIPLVPRAFKVLCKVNLDHLQLLDQSHNHKSRTFKL
jgi:hypothetical protein